MKKGMITTILVRKRELLLLASTIQPVEVVREKKLEVAKWVTGERMEYVQMGWMMGRAEKTGRRRKKRKRVMYHEHRCWVFSRIQNLVVAIQT